MGANKKTTLSEQLDKLKQDGGNGVLSSAISALNNLWAVSNNYYDNKEDNKASVGWVLAPTRFTQLGFCPTFFIFSRYSQDFNPTNPTPIFQAA